jgi:alpha-L-fucosidase
MNRFLIPALCLSLAAQAQFPQGPPRKYDADWVTLARHPLPAWFADAKLGIFVHWGLYSVPAYAPPTGELGKVDFSKWFTNNPYAEWYANSMKIAGSPTAQHHRQKYGDQFGYLDFIPQFNQAVEKWDPAAMAAAFEEAGARYVVLTTKHHDGFTLWPSTVRNPHRDAGQQGSRRDITGELTRAVRARNMKMGLYYSGGLDWSFVAEPIVTMADLHRRIPQTAEYAAYADAQWRELIDRYQPSVLWDDIGYPKAGQTAQIFAEYYNRVPDGVINNRFQVPHIDFTTPEYSKYEKIVEKKWESCRGLGFSFGYNRVEGPEHVLSADALIGLLVDIVSKNGNLLLNVGPRADGSIPEIQLDRLRALGAWLRRNGEAIYATRPWIRPAAKTLSGTQVRFTQKGDSVYAILLDRPQGSEAAIDGLVLPEGAKVSLLGGGEIAWSQSGQLARLALPAALPGESAFAFRITPKPSLLVRE